MLTNGHCENMGGGGGGGYCEDMGKGWVLCKYGGYFDDMGRYYLLLNHATILLALVCVCALCGRVGVIRRVRWHRIRIRIILFRNK